MINAEIFLSCQYKTAFFLCFHGKSRIKDALRRKYGDRVEGDGGGKMD
jgi:hypothetical protein